MPDQTIGSIFIAIVSSLHFITSIVSYSDTVYYKALRGSHVFISKQYFHLASYPVLNSGKAWVRGCIFTAPHSETSQITNLYLSISTPVCANLMPSKNAVKFDKRHNTTGPGQ